MNVVKKPQDGWNKQCSIRDIPLSTACQVMSHWFYSGQALVGDKRRCHTHHKPARSSNSKIQLQSPGFTQQRAVHSPSSTAYLESGCRTVSKIFDYTSFIPACMQIKSWQFTITENILMLIALSLSVFSHFLISADYGWFISSLLSAVTSFYACVLLSHMDNCLI